MPNYLFDTLVIISLTIINGILAMAEMAIISSNSAKMESLAKTNKGAQTALNLINNPASFLSTIQSVLFQVLSAAKGLLNHLVIF